jgi:hypothetical protein
MPQQGLFEGVFYAAEHGQQVSIASYKRSILPLVCWTIVIEFAQRYLPYGLHLLGLAT